MMRAPTRRGCPYTAPSRLARQAMLSVPAPATPAAPAATPVRAAFWPKVGHTASACLPPAAAGASVLVGGAAPVDPTFGPDPPQPAVATRTPAAHASTRSPASLLRHPPRFPPGTG